MPGGHCSSRNAILDTKFGEIHQNEPDHQSPSECLQLYRKSVTLGPLNKEVIEKRSFFLKFLCENQNCVLIGMRGGGGGGGGGGLHIFFGILINVSFAILHSFSGEIHI